MTTRGLAALLCLGLCYASSFSFATPSGLPIDTALSSIYHPASTQALTADIMRVENNDLSWQTPPSAQEDTQTLWPMMPQESLTQLAKTFYPNSPILAQRFIQKSLRLSRSIGIHIVPDVPFQHAQIIAIPNEKEVRALTHRIKKREELQAEHEQLQLSFQLKNSTAAKNQTNKKSEQVVKSRVNDVPIAQELPEIGIPNIALPTWHAPTMQSIAHHIKIARRIVETQMQSAWDTSKTWVMDWQANAFSNIDPLSKKHLTNSWANQNTRITMFVGGLLLLGLAVWRLQKSYLQRKVALLNKIESTLIEPEFTENTIGEIAIGEANEVTTEYRTVLNSAPKMPSDMSDFDSDAPAFHDTESLVEQLSVDAHRKEDAVSDDGITRPKRNR